MHSCRHTLITATLSWHLHQKWRQKSCSACSESVARPEHSHVVTGSSMFSRGSLACQGFSTRNYIGSTFLNESCSRWWHHDVWLCSWSSVWTLSDSLRRCVTAASVIRQSSTSRRTAVAAECVWPTCFLCSWSVHLELINWEFAWLWHWLRQLQKSN